MTQQRPADGRTASDLRRQVLVMGGTSGIGAAIARRFAQSGALVMAAGLVAEPDPDEARPVADVDPVADADAAPPHGGVSVAEVDLRDPGSVETHIAGLQSLDVLVNAAGILRRDEEFRPEVFSDVIAVNLTGTMRACVAARPLLTESGGCVVNVASMLSYFGGPRVPGYAASKGGVVQLTKSLAVAWAAEGIRVNAVAPGWIRTNMTSALREHPTAGEQIIARTPMGRWGEADEVAGAVEFLAGPDATFITGAVLPVDGGYLAT